ncbi:MAG TPA: cytochrome bc complex cytochrome b subunit [Fimbriimonadaceae bacterium]|nr:cytochrome bc complex cytochrome b subunit [Fimbriimonadaceae bacterium]
MKRLQAFLVDRIGLSDSVAYLQKKTVPVHNQTFWYYWGGISLFCFLIQVVTGVLLMIYYRPGPESYESVRQITNEIHFGWLIRSVHNWSATAFLVSVFVHMFSVFFMKAYRRPREVGWWSGILLLLLGLTFGFSGYLLPMDELAYFATKVGLEIPNSIPLIGPPIANLLRGGLEVGEYTVQRFFALHAVILPLLYLPLLMLHLWMVQKHGNALPPSEEQKPLEKRRAMPFFPNFLAKDLAMWLITLNVIALIAALFPWQLGPPADPLTPAPEGIKPEWYFMSSFSTLKILGNIFPGATGEAIGMTLFTLGLVLWTLIPLFDNDRANGRRSRRVTYFGIFVITVLLVTTFWGYFKA